MNIHEYQAKEIFREFGVRVLDGIHCRSVNEALEAYDQLGLSLIHIWTLPTKRIV